MPTTKNKKPGLLPTPKKPPAQIYKVALFAIIFAIIIGLTFVLIRQIYLDSKQSSNSSQANIDEPLTPKSQPTADKPSNLNTLKHSYALPPIKDGLAPVLSTIPTTENVVFLGIDDGANKQPFELQMMEDNNIRASLFLANRFIKDNYDFFKDFQPAGSYIENHTMDHKLLSKLPYEEQKRQICDEADLLKQTYGRRPIFVRPPGGDYNANTQRAAAACGMKAVIMWVAKANGGSMQYQVGHKLRPGDIVLMHFRPEFKQDMQSFIKAENEAGVHTELLEDWLH